MVFGQAFLLIFGGLLLKGATVLVVQEIATKDFIGFIFTLGYLKTIQRIDSYLQAMGLNVANSIGGLAQSLAGATTGVLAGFNSLRKTAGGTMQAFGASSGNKGLFKAGAILGAGARDIANGGLPTNTNLNKRFAAMAGTVGNNDVAVSGNTAAKMMSAYMANPRENARAVGSLSQSSLDAGVSAFTGLENVSGTAIRPNGEIKFNYGDGNAAMLSKTDNGLGQSLLNQDGQAIGYLNSENTLEKGDIINGSLDDIARQTGALGLLDHTDMSEGTATSVSAASFDGNYVSYHSGNGDIVAQTDRHNNAFVPAGFNNEPMAENKQKEILSLAKKNYPDWKTTSDAVHYDNTRKAHYIEMQKYGKSDSHRLYIQDGVSKNTFMVPRENSMEYKTLRINRGSRHKERINMGFAKSPIRTDKK